MTHEMKDEKYRMKETKLIDVSKKSWFSNNVTESRDERKNPLSKMY